MCLQESLQLFDFNLEKAASYLVGKQQQQEQQQNSNATSGGVLTSPFDPPFKGVCV